MKNRMSKMSKVSKSIKNIKKFVITMQSRKL
jgi:hypothetical protein